MEKNTTANIKTKSYIVILFWLLIVGGAFGKNYSIETKAHNDLALHTARALFNQIVLSRAWNAGHGGVYVPVTENTKPNPYLDDPLRDLETSKGIKLTKINPAFMTRQIAEIAANENGLKFHITSLKPIRPANRPTDWERIWLESFEKGTMEQGDFVQNGQDISFRYMAPLIAEINCLQCHAKQGYKAGDIRGGISVTLPSFPKADYLPLMLGYGFAALLGSLIIYIAGHMLDRKEREQQELIKNLQRALLEIKTLQGIVPICSFCKKIRDDKGFWSQVESYVSHHTDAQFSHGVCPECQEEHYPELFNNKKK
jgi:hypothetical protein